MEHARARKASLGFLGPPGRLLGRLGSGRDAGPLKEVKAAKLDPHFPKALKQLFNFCWVSDWEPLRVKRMRKLKLGTWTPRSLGKERSGGPSLWFVVPTSNGGRLLGSGKIRRERSQDARVSGQGRAG